MFEPQASGFGGESFFGMRNVFSWLGCTMLSSLLRMSIFSLATFFTTLFMVDEKSLAVRFR